MSERVEPLSGGELSSLERYDQEHPDILDNGGLNILKAVTIRNFVPRLIATVRAREADLQEARELLDRAKSNRAPGLEQDISAFLARTAPREGQ